MVVKLRKGLLSNVWINIIIFHKELIYFLLLSLAVYSLYVLGHKWVDIPVLPVAMLGTALSILLGFRNGSAYDRWWEARKIWGGIINISRTFTTQIKSYVDDTQQVKNLVYRHLAYINTLRLALRGQNIDYHKELSAFIPIVEWENLQSMANISTQILNLQASEIKANVKNGHIDSEFKQYELMGSIKELFDLQGRAERIKKTPFPKYYELYINVFFFAFITLFPFSIVGNLDKMSQGLDYSMTWLIVPITLLVGFVFAAIDKSGSATEDPFENQMSDTPMTSICITIERDLRQMLGEKEIPAALVPDENGILM
ncbi:MAG: bestrophin family ion channel [Saprospiraceae bacterium]